MIMNINRKEVAQNFTVELMSKNKILFSIVSSLIKIKELKTNNYTVVPRSIKQGFNKRNPADILFLDIDFIDEMPEIDSSTPTIIISGMGKDIDNYSGTNVYLLPRKKLSIRLLGILEEISMKHFNCMPKVDIGNTLTLRKYKNVRKVINSTRTSDFKHNGKVLVVDDSITVRTQMQLVLDMYGLEVDLAENAEAAFVKTEHQQYDMIFLDVVLPEMDGYKACRVLKSRSCSKNTPIVMLTSKSSTFNRLQGVMSGCNKYLTKPVKASQLQTELVKHIPALNNKVLI